MKDPAKNKLKNKSGGPERDIKNVPGQAEKSGVFSSLLKKEGVRSVIASVVCVLGGILVGFIVLLLLSIFAENVSVGEAFSGIAIVLGGPFSGGSGRDILFQLGNMLFQSAPLIMTGLSVALAFKTGLFNIGAPGQYLMGAMGALLVALSIPQGSVPSFVIWILAFLTGVALGMIWGSIPGFFKAYFNVNEVIVCIMTNWIAANVVSWVFKATGDRFINIEETKVNFIKKTSYNGVATATFGLDKLFANSYFDISIFIASAIAILLYVMINKTTFGYELKACGYNKHASKYAGMNEKRNIILAMAIAGALAAGGAALWCLNGSQDFKWDTYLTLPADGFNGIPVALLAGSNPIGVIFSAIFLKYIGVGGSNLAAQTSFNEYVSPLIVAVIIYFAGFSKLIKDLLAKQLKKAAIKADKKASSGAPPAAETVIEDKTQDAASCVREDLKGGDHE